MTNDEAKTFLKAKLRCMELDSGFDTDCNNYNCDECSLNYEQGNLGEQKEALRMAIKALETVERIEARKQELEKKLHNGFSLSEATEHYALTKLLREAESEDKE